MSPNKWETAQTIVKIVDFFTENHPNIMIVLASDYDCEVGGLVKIKWDDELKEIVHYIETNMEKSLEKRFDVFKKIFFIFYFLVPG